MKPARLRTILSLMRRRAGRWRGTAGAVSVVEVDRPQPGPGVDRVRELFDDAFYAATYDDVVRAGLDGFEHYMRYGWGEGRDPSARFNALYYRDAHLDGSYENPLIHYANIGEELGLSMAPPDADSFLELQKEFCQEYFSERDYRDMSGFDGDDALLHYLRTGWREGFAPSLSFDPQEYLSDHRFLSAHDVSPLYHHASQRRARGDEIPLSPDLLVPPDETALLLRLEAPTRMLQPPPVIELAPMPEFIRRRLTPIWNSGHVGGKPVSSYRFENVYVTGEGLVFTADARLIEITRSQHIDHYIREGALAVATAEKTGCATIEAGVLAESRGARNYGHFILEMLPRAWFARSELDCRWPAIIQGHGSPVEHVSREALRSIGFAPDEILSVGRDPVFVRELIFIDGLAAHPLYLSPLALRCFDEIAERMPAGPTGKVYASRGSGSPRDFADEPAVAAALTAAGFAAVATGGMRFEAQVALFREAEHVVGVTGAALTNLLFCRPGTQVTVFSPTSASEVLFWLIAELRGLRYREVRCEEVGPQRGELPWDRALAIAPQEVLRLIS